MQHFSSKQVAFEGLQCQSSLRLQPWGCSGNVYQQRGVVARFLQNYQHIFWGMQYHLKASGIWHLVAQLQL